MTDHQFDDPLKELEAALAIEPSPAFAAGVRARVEEGGRTATRWPAWQQMAAAAVLAVAVLGGFVWRGRQVHLQPALETPIEPVAVATDGATPVATTPATTAPKPPVATRAAAHAATTPVALEALVQPDQAIALNRFMAALKARATTESARTEIAPVVLEELPRIIPVRIEPIAIAPLVPNSPSSGGREKDR